MDALGFLLLDTILISNTVKTILGLTMGTLYSSITGTISGIISTVEWLIKNTDDTSEIADIIKKLDIYMSVTIIGLHVSEMKDKEYPESILKSLESISIILHEICNHLKTIKEKIIQHNNGYFSRWRNIDLSKECKILMDTNIILHIRYKMLINLLKIKN